MIVISINDYSDTVGGAEQAISNTNSALSKLGVKVFTYSLSSSSESILNYLDRFFSIFHFLKFCLFILKHKPNIIHAHNTSRFISPSPLLAARFFRVPVIMTFHDYHLICPKTWMMYSKCLECPYGFSTKCLLSNCETFHTGVLWFPYQWLKWFKVLIHRAIIKYTVNIALCPNYDLQRWVDSSLMLKTIYLPNFLPVNTIKINRTPSYYLFVGRLSKEKGVSSLITTFAKFSHEKLVIIGDGPEKDSLIKLTERLGLSNRVTFLGKVSHSNLQFYYSKAYALVVPSIWKENNPLVILESLSVGIPVIATSRGGLLDFAKNGAACFNYNTESELIKLLKYVKSYNRLVTLPEIYSESVHLERLVSIYSSFS